MRLQIKFRCVQSAGAFGVPPDSPPETKGRETHLVTLVAHQQDRDNRSVWDDIAPDAKIAIGSMPPGLAECFKLGRDYQITIEPL